MIIDKSQLLGHEAAIAELKRALVHLSDPTHEGEVLNIAALLGDTPINWDGVKYQFQRNFRTFDHLLFKLHFKRKAALSEPQRNRIVLFLAIGYLHTGDVRYFNEFLYFYRESDQNRPYWWLMLHLFFNHLSPENHHRFTLCDRQEVDNFIREAEKSIEQTRRKPLSTAFRLGLLGSPTFFKKIRSHFVSKGFDIRTYFIPFHPDKKINFLLKNWITFWLFCLAKGVNFRFSRLNFHYKDPQITEKLKAEELDIGFHKLGFIIKKNIIDSFKVGIINDHWAVLPYIRGRSTIEYTLLFGFPVAATAHIVEEGIDSGGIISIYNYEKVLYDYSSIKEIHSHVRREREFRAIDSIELLSRAKKPMISNLPEKGLMFYAMHPLLQQFVDKQVLKR